MRKQPGEGDINDRLQRAKQRRPALVEAGCSTYELAMRDGYPAILCLCCGVDSHHPEDIASAYCAFCHEFHAKERPQ